MNAQTEKLYASHPSAPFDPFIAEATRAKSNLFEKRRQEIS
jgi:hypothetical protein